MKKFQLSKHDLKDFGLIFLGTLLQALALRLFLVPANLASGGISGLAQIINHYTGWPIGLMIFLGNLPVFLLGWRYLGGIGFLVRTAFAVLLVSFFTDFLALYLPANGITNDLCIKQSLWWNYRRDWLWPRISRKRDERWK